MKQSQTNNFDNNEIYIQDNSLLTKITIAVFILILNICVLTAQNGRQVFHTGIGMELLSSANGHGGITSANLSLNSPKQSFELGLLFQNQSSTVKGLKFAYSKNLSNSEYNYRNSDYASTLCDILQLNFFSYFQYLDNASLSGSVIRNEKLIRKEVTIDYNKIKFNTMELGAGIELRVNFSRRVSWHNNISASVYYHDNYVRLYDHEQIAPTLNISTGLHIIL